MTSRRQRKKRMSRMPRRKAAVPRFFCGERAKKKVMVEGMEVVRGRPMRNRICRWVCEKRWYLLLFFFLVGGLGKTDVRYPWRAWWLTRRYVSFSCVFWYYEYDCARQMHDGTKINKLFGLIAIDYQVYEKCEDEFILSRIAILQQSNAPDKKERKKEEYHSRRKEGKGRWLTWLYRRTKIRRVAKKQHLCLTVRKITLPWI